MAPQLTGTKGPSALGYPTSVHAYAILQSCGGKNERRSRSTKDFDRKHVFEHIGASYTFAVADFSKIRPYVVYSIFKRHWIRQLHEHNICGPFGYHAERIPSSDVRDNHGR